MTVQSTLNILYQVKYYVGQKDSPQDWKCQPNKWLSSKEEIHEVLVGWFSVTLGSALSAALATWVINGGYTSLYYSPGQYGLLWALVEGPLAFIVTVSPGLYPLTSPWLTLIALSCRTTSRTGTTGSTTCPSSTR